MGYMTLGKIRKTHNTRHFYAYSVFHSAGDWVGSCRCARKMAKITSSKWLFRVCLANGMHAFACVDNCELGSDALYQALVKADLIEVRYPF